MVALSRQQALFVLCHDDGPCADGKKHTPLIEGHCPACGFTPDMQSTCLDFYCPRDGSRLIKGVCPTCNQTFDTELD